jgi:hypothetical protein
MGLLSNVLLSWCFFMQVSLGNSRELLDADYNAEKLPKGFHSVKGLGKMAPDPAENLVWLVSSSSELYAVTMLRYQSILCSPSVAHLRAF